MRRFAWIVLGTLIIFLAVWNSLDVLNIPIGEKGGLIDYAEAAFTANSPISPQQTNRGIAQVLNSSGICSIANNGASLTNGVVLYNSASSSPGGQNGVTLGNGSRITSILCATNDTAANVVQLILSAGAASANKLYYLASVSIPGNSATLSTGGTPAVNLLSAVNIPGLGIESDGNPYLDINNLDQLTICVWTTAVASNKALTCIANARDW